ncbi:SAM-dependent methyltransferase [Labrys monachus]|uniref:Cyclopropane-fatty-acyl-phospholipid synthase n=1 Tax=Labrys monachus TaxID=217067 RepID=A0ABU0FMI0_9HYPH|nr:cyclopropane-fatty-acyl-phospholipid synthase family protein [Labrys monachus]MDQ0395809.1 cyclopropane-fatty-acyl-phospholipid synthase [Labrys monachus]
MTLVASAIGMIERTSLPDWMTRGGVQFLVGRTRRQLARLPCADAAFAGMMATHPIALHAEDANAQHYEIPADFFGLVLGPNRKYSCCLYDEGAGTLAEAEEHALARTMDHADLRDGQAILELGCGWGSLSLAMAARFPAARITCVSNSASQRAFIQSRAATRRLANLKVITADMNVFAPAGRFDRVVSVEMFEHMTNWRDLLTRVRSWLEPGGSLFLHVFSHRSQPYRFDHADKADWIAQHFFTGGIMPSHDLIRQFGDLFVLDEAWRWSGRNYERTALDWLANFDANGRQIDRILAAVYGTEAALWRRRWRLFFLATAGLFGNRGGTEWGVSHYRLRPHMR